MPLTSRAEAEALRIRSAYKRLVLLGKATLPGAVARRLVGPDCAFHLYFRRGTLAGRREHGPFTFDDIGEELRSTYCSRSQSCGEGSRRRDPSLPRKRLGRSG